MIDWADEIALRLCGVEPGSSYLLDGEAIDFNIRVAAALRKAKADGIRAAAGLCGSDDFWPDHDRWFLEHRLTDVADKLEGTESE